MGFGIRFHAILQKACLVLFLAGRRNQDNVRGGSYPFEELRRSPIEAHHPYFTLAFTCGQLLCYHRPKRSFTVKEVIETLLQPFFSVFVDVMVLLFTFLDTMQEGQAWYRRMVINHIDGRCFVAPESQLLQKILALLAGNAGTPCIQAACIGGKGASSFGKHRIR